MNEPQAPTKEASVVSVLAHAEVLGVSGEVVFSVDQWLADVRRWQLSGGELALAMHCVRLESDQPSQLRLSCERSERASLNFYADKFEQAIRRVNPSWQVVWVKDWSETWVTPAMHKSLQTAEERKRVRESIEQQARFGQLCQALSLVPDWDQMVSLM